MIGKKNYVIVFTIIFTLAFIYPYQNNLDLKHSERLFIAFQISCSIMFELANYANSQNVLPEAESFKHPVHITTKKHIASNNLSARKTVAKLPSGFY